MVGRGRRHRGPARSRPGEQRVDQAPAWPCGPRDQAPVRARRGAFRAASAGRTAEQPSLLRRARQQQRAACQCGARLVPPRRAAAGGRQHRAGAREPLRALGEADADRGRGDPRGPGQGQGCARYLRAPRRRRARRAGFAGRVAAQDRRHAGRAGPGRAAGPRAGRDRAPGEHDRHEGGAQRIGADRRGRGADPDRGSPRRRAGGHDPAAPHGRGAAHRRRGFPAGAVRGAARMRGEPRAREGIHRSERRWHARCGRLRQLARPDARHPGGPADAGQDAGGAVHRARQCPPEERDAPGWLGARAPGARPPGRCDRQRRVLHGHAAGRAFGSLVHARQCRGGAQRGGRAALAHGAHRFAGRHESRAGPPRIRCHRRPRSWRHGARAGGRAGAGGSAPLPARAGGSRRSGTDRAVHGRGARGNGAHLAQPARVGPGPRAGRIPGERAPRVPHAEGQWPRGRRHRAGRIRVVHREPAEPAARQDAHALAAHPGRAARGGDRAAAAHPAPGPGHRARRGHSRAECARACAGGRQACHAGGRNADRAGADAAARRAGATGARRSARGAGAHAARHLRARDRQPCGHGARLDQQGAEHARSVPAAGSGISRMPHAVGQFEDGRGTPWDTPRRAAESLAQKGLRQRRQPGGRGPVAGRVLHGGDGERQSQPGREHGLLCLARRSARAHCAGRSRP